MRVFALADLHLSGSVNKPMDVFGPTWDNHLARIREAWLETVGEEDLVLIPGDVSWAMHLAEAKTDLCTIASFPGKKLILRGNHDYWWNSLAKVRGALPEGMYALQNDAFVFGDVAIAGSRGWTCPGSVGFDEAADRPIYEREVIRMGLSLSGAPKDKLLLCMMHYPPFKSGGSLPGLRSCLSNTAQSMWHMATYTARLAGMRLKASAMAYNTRFAPRIIWNSNPSLSLRFETGKTD